MQYKELTLKEFKEINLEKELRFNDELVYKINDLSWINDKNTTLYTEIIEIKKNYKGLFTVRTFFEYKEELGYMGSKVMTYTDNIKYIKVDQDLELDYKQIYFLYSDEELKEFEDNY
jgi:hypothetical protein